MLNNLTLQEIKKLARLGKKLSNRIVHTPTTQQIYDAMKYIKSLSGNSFVHSNYARNVLIILTIPNLNAPKLLEAIRFNKKIYLNSYID